MNGSDLGLMEVVYFQESQSTREVTTVMKLNAHDYQLDPTLGTRVSSSTKELAACIFQNRVYLQWNVNFSISV